MMCRRALSRKTPDCFIAGDAHHQERRRQGAPRLELQPGASPLEINVSLALPDGRRQRLSARVRGFATDQGQRRYMAVVEDRSAATRARSGPEAKARASVVKVA